MTIDGPTPKPKQDFARNLRVLCSTYKSVAEVCRLTGINRQQFGRYLNGTYLPSQHNLMRICKVFGVSEADLHLPEQQFVMLLEAGSPSLRQGGGWLGRDLERRMPTMSQQLWKYLGWYASFSYSFGWPNMVIRSLVNIYRYRGRVFSRTIDRVKDPISKRRFVYKNQGIVTMSAGKIFIVEHDQLEGDGFYVKYLHPTPRSHVGLLTGIMTGTSHRSLREISSVRLVMQYLGPTIDIRAELGKCGVFKPDFKNLKPQILEMIRNDIEPDKTVLQPRPTSISMSWS